MNQRRLSSHEKRRVFNGLQSDEYRLSMSHPSWEKVKSGFAPAQSGEAPGCEVDASLSSRTAGQSTAESQRRNLP